MIKLRQLAGALIVYEDKMLLQKRPDNSRLFPGLWTTAGGHMEQEEINDPCSACLREVYEETGFIRDDFVSIKLKYMTQRRKDDEIRVMYTFILQAKHLKEPWETDEGCFHWIAKDEVMECEFSFVMQQIVEHYLRKGYKDNTVINGALKLCKGLPNVVWSEVDQWDGCR